MAKKFSVPKIGVCLGKKTKISHAAQKNTGNPTKIKRILRGVSGQWLKKYDVRLAKFNVENTL